MKETKKHKNKRTQKKNNDKITVSTNKNKFPPMKFDYDKYCIEAKDTEKKGYKITLNLLDSLWNRSLDMDKIPLLIIGLNRNSKERFLIYCNIQLECK